MIQFILAVSENSRFILADMVKSTDQLKLNILENNNVRYRFNPMHNVYSMHLISGISFDSNSSADVIVKIGGASSGHVLSKTNLNGANLLGSNLQKAKLWNANLQMARLWKANLQKAILLGVNLQEASLLEANLQNADLQEVNLQNANLRKANLQEANLAKTSLQNAHLRKANLQGVRELSVDQLCEAATLYKAELDPELEQQIKEKCPYLLTDKSAGFCQ